MDELMQVVIAHHLYLIVPMVVGVWIWSRWGGWKDRFDLWQLRRALERRRQVSDARKSENSASTSDSGPRDARDA